MPKFICITAAIECIIKSAIKNKGYKGQNIQIEYQIDWDDEYQHSVLFKTSTKKYNDDYYIGFIINANNYPLNNDILLIYHEGKYIKISELEIYNTSGWNKDPRTRGNYDYYLDDRDDTNIINKEWYRNYSDIYKIIRKEGITMNDIANGVFSVKSGKDDNNYELFTNAECKIKDNSGSIQLNIFMDFDHGS